MKYFSTLRFSLTLMILASLSIGVAAQKSALQPVKTGMTETSSPTALVAPIKFTGPGPSGNPNCATLNAIPNTTPPGPFSHIIEDFEIKLDFSDPNGTFPITNNPAPFQRIVVGPQSATQSVTISSGSSQIFSWSSTLQITAVIMKLGPNAYVYPYKPFKQSDTNLNPGDVFPEATEGLSHVTFCFADPTTPTAGDGAIGGRVVDENGRGISKAQLVLINGTTGEARITLTSPFGYYMIGELDVNELYVLNVSHKTFNFEERQRTISLSDSLTDVNFIGRKTP